MIIPHSNGEPEQIEANTLATYAYLMAPRRRRRRHRLAEFNRCHSPENGEFCSAPDSVGGGGPRMVDRRLSHRVGITSYQSEAFPNKLSKQVFEEMRAFEVSLRTLPGVNGVTVQPGVGAWEGGSEPTWVVSYRGNGAARQLIARTGQQYQQSAVLMLSGCKGRDCQPVVEFHFDTPIGTPARTEIHQGLVAAGLGGWTWSKRRGRSVLRMASVPQLSGGDAGTHLAATAQISSLLTRRGFSHRRTLKRATVEVFDASNYSQIGGS